MRRVFDFLELTPPQGPLVLPARVVAPDKKQVSRRMAKTKAHRLRQEAQRREQGRA